MKSLLKCVSRFLCRYKYFANRKERVRDFLFRFDYQMRMRVCVLKGWVRRVLSIPPRWRREEQIFLALEKYKDVLPCRGFVGRPGVPTNCIWQLWWQGEESAPDIVRMCMESVRQHNLHRPVVVLTEKNLNEYVTLPDYILRKHAQGVISTTFLSDIIRLYLLAQYGGTWVDATIYMTGDMPSEIEESDFFLFKNRAWMKLGKVPRYLPKWQKQLDRRSNPYHCFSNWFIHSSRGNRYVCKMLGMLLAYWRENDSIFDYFLFHYLGTWALFADEECRKIYEESPWVSQGPPHELQTKLTVACSNYWIEDVCKKTPIHKLTYKFDRGGAVCVESVLGAMYRRWHDGAALHENKYPACDDDGFNKQWKVNVDSENRLRRRVAEGKKIRVTFLVAMTSMFPAKPLMEYMLGDVRYDVNLVVIPELRFGMERAQREWEQAQSELVAYRQIMRVAPLNPYEDTIRLREFTDIVVPPTPYNISTPWYDYGCLQRQGLLTAIVNYGFYRCCNYDRQLINSSVYQTAWKVFVETKYNLAEYENYTERIKGGNTLLTGYCKMDAYKHFETLCSGKKFRCVLIAPHHSVKGGYNDVLQLSNFMRYSDFFLELPKKYPEVQFIFRPHPALFSALRRDAHWGKERSEEYEHRMKSFPNVRWSDKGNYMEDFGESDAMIQDCGSFLVDYFYTGKPQCYMLHSEKDIEEKFAPLGQMCLSHCYIAYDEAAITQFMERVVLAGDDPGGIARRKFAREEVMLNYPHASAKAADLLYAALT